MGPSARHKANRRETNDPGRIGADRSNRATATAYRATATAYRTTATSYRATATSYRTTTAKEADAVTPW